VGAFLQEAERNLINNLEARKIQAHIFDTVDEVCKAVIDQIPASSFVGIGNSQTIKSLRLVELLEEKKCIVYDKTKAVNAKQSREVILKALNSDYYLMSCNAISLEGHIINIDHTGNRVSALLYGPKKVVIVLGVNKIVNTLEDAVSRARNEAAIKNAKRAGLKPPCVELGRCIDCRSDDRVCNSLVILEGQAEKDRVSVYIVRQELGF
jgi:hypothetical protein